MYCLRPRAEQAVLLCENVRLRLPLVVKVLVTITVHLEFALAALPLVVTLAFGK